MRFSGQTKDGAIDNLLRAYVSRPSNLHMCPDFDPDQANAYIERTLTSTVRLQYESHLSVCAACRKSVVELMRMAEADSLAAVAVRQIPEATRFGGLKRIFGALSQPQWAIAAAAVIVLAVSLPLFMTRSRTPETPQTVANQQPNEPAVSPAPPAAPFANARSEASAPSLVAASKREGSDRKTELEAKNVPAPAPTPESSAAFAADEISKKTDVRNAVEPVGEMQSKSQGQVAAAPTLAAAPPASQVTRNDADKTRQQQPEKDAAQQVSDSKAANEEGAKEKTERAEVVAAPPPAEVARGRSNFRRSGKLALRDPNTTEAVRPEERKFSGKKFLFKDGAWTDKDFNPDKDLPVVTIIRDSNVYKEVLTKRPGLKPFLTGFLATERAVIVYKGTVYKLIPQ